MPVTAPIDTSKSLAELTGIDWGSAPAEAGTLVRERHQLRRTPIHDLPHDAIVRFLDMGSDADILIPVALDRLRADPDAVGLLCAVLRAEDFGWRERPELVVALRDRVYTVTSEIGQITNDIERLQYEAAVWRFYALFERSLSKV
jgi:hypothetical protein